jgi:hypothetical protein
LAFIERIADSSEIGEGESDVDRFEGCDAEGEGEEVRGLFVDFCGGVGATKEECLLLLLLLLVGAAAAAAGALAFNLTQGIDPHRK